jgi:hexokinase
MHSILKVFVIGKEEGNFLALDLGGTNLRVVLVTLLGQGKFKTVSSKSRVSDELKLGPMRNLCGKLFFFKKKKRKRKKKQYPPIL